MRMIFQLIKHKVYWIYFFIKIFLEIVYDLSKMSYIKHILNNNLPAKRNVLTAQNPFENYFRKVSSIFIFC